MRHEGKRSKHAIRKRLAKRIIHATSFRDPELSETIARVDINFAEKIGYKALIVHVERGEILADSRGRGTEQIPMEVKMRNA